MYGRLESVQSSVHEMKKKETRQGIEILRALVNEGHRVFTAKDARSAARTLSISEKYVVEALHHLKQRGWIRPIKRGVYAITEQSGFSTPPHDYEVAMALVSPSAISHWTALYHHHLTQQIPQTIFALTPTGTRIPDSVRGSNYHFVHVKPDFFFGIDEVWIGDGKVRITDPERTLLDGLRQPQHCGGIQEVLAAFDMQWPRLDTAKIIDYALQLDKAVISRLGWVLQQHGCEKKELAELRDARAQGVRRLDASGPDRGPVDRQWQIRYNVGA
jgi:predicted transcriptional regulator of viral defense system